MFTPADFCKHFGMEIDVFGRVKVGREDIDMFSSSSMSYYDVYINDMWRFHMKRPRHDFCDRFMDIKIDPERVFVPSGATAMLFCLEGI